MRIGIGLMALALISTPSSSAPAGDGRAFQAAMAVAMDRMMMDMHGGGDADPDRAFAGMMIPHHEGAIEMARLELQHGRDERLRRLAQGIIVEQQQEVVLMQQILSAKQRKLADSRHPSMQHGSKP